MNLIIKNIGPIEEVELKLNRFNVLIGPQSSGKSTIAKIVSFCLWMEKNVLLQQDSRYITRAFIHENLLSFHKLTNYLNSGYSIHFIGEILEFRFDDQICEVKLNAHIETCKMSKVAYIPAERNTATVPNIASLKLPMNNLRSYLFDWLEIHQKFTKENAIGLLKLNLKYFYEETSKKDIIQLPNGKEITLEEASSGLQSVVPLYVYIYYLTNWVYEHREDLSFEKKQKMEDALVRNFTNAALRGKESTRYINTEEALAIPELVKSVRDVVQEFELLSKAESREVFNAKIRDMGGLKKILMWQDNLSYPHHSNIIIEEPELNLFPETQKDLMYALTGMINIERDKVLLTTHSPYLLYALNNCMMGYLSKDHIPPEDEDLAWTKRANINPEYVSVWEIRDGKFASYQNNPNQTIQDERGLIRNNYFDRIMKNIMCDFSALMEYSDED